MRDFIREEIKLLASDLRETKQKLKDAQRANVSPIDLWPIYGKIYESKIIITIFHLMLNSNHIGNRDIHTIEGYRYIYVIQRFLDEYIQRIPSKEKQEYFSNESKRVLYRKTEIKGVS